MSDPAGPAVERSCPPLRASPIGPRRFRNRRRQEAFLGSDEHFFGTEPDNDTLGGRLWRAREATGRSEAEVARAVGVRRETLRAWEGDRSEPRANRLVTLAGILNVSPAWLLHGVGEAPHAEDLAAEISALREQIGRMRDLRRQTEIAIAAIEKSLERIASRALA